MSTSRPRSAIDKNPAVVSALEATQKTTFPPVEPETTSFPPSSILSQWLSHPFNVTWRAALVKAPRLVPLSALKITAPEGPFPFIYDFKSPRGSHIIPLYIWIPETTSEAPSWPVIIDFHGGGFVLGSCLEQAPFCGQMCRELGAVVISVDYRMGPIAQFPAANWDAEDVLRAVREPETEAGLDLREAIAKKAGKRLDRRLLSEAKKAKKAKRPSLLSRSSTAALTLKPKDVRSTAFGSTLTPTSSVTPVPSRSATPSPNPSINQGSTILDPTRIAVSGFSSGGNLALNMGLHIHPPQVPQEWPSVFPPDYSWNIPLLLFFPSFDSRLLPSQRTRPDNLPAGSPFWAEVDDILAPSYLPRDQAGHPRASPGLADVKTSLHMKAKAFLVLPELDTLAAQSEVWVKKVEEAGRAGDLEVRREKGMKHGWTQFPVSWLSEEEKRSREDVFKRTIEFVRESWNDRS